MLSNELIIIILIFLAYISIWFGAVNHVMDASKQGMYILHQRSVVDYVKYSIDSMCLSAIGSSETLTFPRQEVIEFGTDNVRVGNQSRKVICAISGPSSVTTNTLHLVKCQPDKVDVSG